MKATEASRMQRGKRRPGRCPFHHAPLEAATAAFLRLTLTLSRRVRSIHRMRPSTTRSSLHQFRVTSYGRLDRRALTTCINVALWRSATNSPNPDQWHHCRCVYSNIKLNTLIYILPITARYQASNILHTCTLDELDKVKFALLKREQPATARPSPQK